MLPSSLIFAVILAVWAAYLMQHWVRRRDHIATARSVDRFSEAMRVLERRQHRPHLDLSEPTARSYAVSLTRPGAPDVIVKRAQPSASVASAPPARSLARETAPRQAAARAERPGAGIGRAGVAGQVGVARTVVAKDRATRAVSADNSVRTRGILLLVAAGVMLVGTALGTMAVLPWWTIPVAIGVFGVALFAVRQSVQRAARSSRRARAATSARSTRRSAVSIPAAVVSARSAKVGRSAAAAGGGAAAALAATIQNEGEELAAAARVAVREVVHPRVARDVYDIDALDQARANAAAAELIDATEPIEAPLAAGTWQPVPVPPPTYTLKAKAHTRPVLNDLPPELPDDGTDLSLDEEFEDLPVAIRGLA